jgi:hypothetical protein
LLRLGRNLDKTLPPAVADRIMRQYVEPELARLPKLVYRQK